MARHCWTIRRWRLPIVGVVLAASVVLGCSDPQKRYEVLSFFFDGVPDPNAPRAEERRTSSGGTRTVVHKPYADNQCNSCHLNTNDIFARAQVREDICLTCHVDIPTQHAVMHGPVVSNACQMCHSPHSSAVPHLLRKPAPAVCTQCHEPEGLKLMHTQPFDPKASCIDCHSGHGGSDHSLLLASAPRGSEPATTQPALPDGSGVRR
jgi:predicted CXXCH cytochrome family protein